MTPAARKLYIKALEQNPRLAEEIANSVCFEVTEVLHLIKEVGAEFNKKFVDKTPNLNADYDEEIAFNKTGNEFDHGGLVFPLADKFIIELNTTPINKLAIMCQTVANNKIDVCYFVNNNIEYPLLGFLHFDADFFSVWVNPETEGEDAKKTTASLVMLVALALIVINAPYGVKREAPPLHKGQVKHAKRAGFILKPHHIITLDKSKAPPEGSAGTGEHSGKAFHFVRSHMRNYKTGRKVIVKAHWRGDPRLGIHRASYRVKV